MSDTSGTRNSLVDLPPIASGCCGWFFPYGFLYEWKKLACPAIPIMLTSLVEYLIAPVSLFFCGKLGKTELAAAGLAISVFHTAGVSFIAGLLTASETLFAQTYGGKNKFRLGVQVQRAFVILTICCIPCWAVHIVIEPILLSSNQPPLISKYAGEYLLGLMPGLFFISCFEIMTKYVQAQNKVFPPLVAGALGNLVNAGAHYLLIYHANLGIIGSAFSQSLGYMMEAACLLVYILVSKIYRTTWDAIHVELWHDWGKWFRLGIPGVMMSGLEWWVCESGSLTAGIRGEQALAVQTILNNIESLIFCAIPMGFGIAVTIRIGQLVGANRPVGPRGTAFVGIITLVVAGLLNIVILAVFRFQIPRIFTSDPGIIAATAYALPSIMVFQFFDSVCGVCGGIIRGVGMQKVGAVVSCVSMYCIGCPLALCLLLLTDWEVPGFWWGLSIGMAIEIVLYIYFCCRIDWDKMCKEAAERTKIKFIKRGSVDGKLDVFLGSDRLVGQKTEGQQDREEVEEVKDDEVEEEEDKRTKVGKRTPHTQACPPTVLWTRTSMIGVCVSLLVISVACRLGVDLKNHFQNHCVFSNGTVVPLSNATRQETLNCTRILP